jgi:three-Cys-motif partner protein
MDSDDFFYEVNERSQVKTKIVTKYFRPWAKIVSRNVPQIAYIDLFAGPGSYADGTKSTPILILETAIRDPVLCKKLIALFNDANADYARSLEEEIRHLPGIQELVHPPQVTNWDVDDAVAGALDSLYLVPSLLFADPWGYRGLSAKLIGAVVKHWGCDAILFFNYNRINAALANAKVKEHVDALFGSKRAERLRSDVMSLNPIEREEVIIKGLTEALQEQGGRYVLAFRFTDARGTRTSHHLVFVTKNALAYGIMKDIMAKESSRAEQGVASFEYNPADHWYVRLFDFERPLEDLSEMLVDEFAGQTLKMVEVYYKHHIDRPYTKANYKEALRKLEEAGEIRCTPPADERRKGTLADKVWVVFPER